MQRRLSTKTSLFLIIGSGLVVLGIVAGVGLHYLNKAESAWNDYIEVVEAKQQKLATIRSLMGYGGAIHNFKNYVLRGEAESLKISQEKGQSALEAIEAYRALGPLQEVERAALQRVREMVEAYAHAALRVREFHAQGLLVTEIDSHVRIDDRLYLPAMAALSGELSRLTEVRTAALSKHVSDATKLLAVIASIGGIFFILLGVSLKRDIERRDREMRREIIERRNVEEELIRSQSTLKKSETLRDSFVEMAFSAQEEERRRIARELHDEAGQALTSLIVGLQQIKESSDAKASQQRAEVLQGVAESVVDELARMARGLHPRLLEDLGFTDAVQHQAAEIQRIHNLEVETQMVGFEQSALPDPIATALYRIIQEALTNVLKHANATAVNVVVSRDQETVRLIIEDDGCGFDAEECKGGGLGLLGIDERVRMLRGTIEIESNKESGTTLAVRIPLKKAQV